MVRADADRHDQLLTLIYRAKLDLLVFFSFPNQQVALRYTTQTHTLHGVNLEDICTQVVSPLSLRGETCGRVDPISSEMELSPRGQMQLDDW